MDIQKRIVILGAAESGIGAAVLAKLKGFDVFVSDSGKIKDEYKQKLNQSAIIYEEGGHTDALILSADEVIKSPGVPYKVPIVQKIIEKGIPVISEIEFAGRYTQAKKICITGSNGKTTTTSLIYHMMKKAGLNVGLAGNIGKSFALQVAECDYDYYVIELSSFQLDGMYEFKADIAVLLNITPDHLDRYDYDFSKYAKAKMRILRNLSEGEYFIFCSDDDITIKELEQIVTTVQKLPFSVKQKEEVGAWSDDNNVYFSVNDRRDSILLSSLSLRGKHNTYNSMAAGLAGNALNITKEIIRESLMDFQGVEHRLEFVKNVNGVDYINDSKATNVNSVWYALECMNKPVVWIVGGTDKGNDYSELFELVDKKVKAIVCLGVNNTKLLSVFTDRVTKITEALSMDEAIAKATSMAEMGDVVLLSPACASFDLFENYEDRGDKFKLSVRNL